MRCCPDSLITQRGAGGPGSLAPPPSAEEDAWDPAPDRRWRRRRRLTTSARDAGPGPAATSSRSGPKRSVIDCRLPRPNRGRGRRPMPSSSAVSGATVRPSPARRGSAPSAMAVELQAVGLGFGRWRTSVWVARVASLTTQTDRTTLNDTLKI
jgi:hypothetical protein